MTTHPTWPHRRLHQLSPVSSVPVRSSNLCIDIDNCASVYERVRSNVQEGATAFENYRLSISRVILSQIILELGRMAGSGLARRRDLVAAFKKEMALLSARYEHCFRAKVAPDYKESYWDTLSRQAAPHKQHLPNSVWYRAMRLARLEILNNGGCQAQVQSCMGSSVYRA